MAMTDSAPKPRSAIAKEYTWNKESVFAEKADFDKAVETIKTDLIPAVNAFKGRLADGATTLADCMDAVVTLRELSGKVSTYGSMSISVDSNNQESVAMYGIAASLGSQVGSALSFINPELLEIGKDTLLAWTESEPRLSDFKHLIDNLFRTQKHVRSAEIEEIMGMVNDPFGTLRTTYGAFTSGDMQFAPVTDSDGNTINLMQGNYDNMLDGSDRELRQSAYESYTDAYLQNKNTLASLLTTSIKQDAFNARVRGFDSTLEASLFNNNIPTAVFDNLIDTFKKNIPTWHKYWNVRRRILGVDKVYPYDIWAPLAKEPTVVPYTQSVDWICEGLKPLGDDYVNALRKGCLEDRWVDLYPNEGKRQGAFSNGMHATMPFIMMSYHDNLGGMSTLAHELGHSMHSYLSRKNQSVFYSRYTLFVAEVASNFNQAMTRAYLREANDDVNFQIALIEEAMGNFHRYFFIMPTLARFELEVHNRVWAGKGVTANDMNNLMADLFAEGYGDEMSYDRDRIGITWATFGHLYSNFYVYQYATGISAAHALADKILNEGDSASQKYIEFLSAGGAMYPIDALNHAGVDMLKPDAVETTFSVLSDLVDRLEQLAGV